MPVYQYKAKSLNGEEITGEMAAISVEALHSAMREQGYFVVDTKKRQDLSLGNIFQSRINTKDIAVFSRQFAVMLTSGITILESIKILGEQAQKRRMVKVLGHIYDELQKGRVLSECFNLYPNVFPEFMRSMIRVGEVSGTLDVIMERLADYYERDNKMRKKIKSAMTYPMILGVMTVGVVILLLTFVLPSFSGTLASMGGEMPGITVFLLNLSELFVAHFALIMAMILALVGILYYWIKTPSGQYWKDSVKLRFPIVSMTSKKVLTSRFARSMGILLKSGIPIVESMTIIGDLIGNKVVEKRFRKCADEVQKGHGIASPLEEVGVFPPLLIHMVAVGEKTGELDDMLLRTANFFDEEVEDAIDRATALVEPLLILILAVIVGTILISVMLPMVSIMDNVM